jgi:hypothetical protein
MFPSWTQWNSLSLSLSLSHTHTHTHAVVLIWAVEIRLSALQPVSLWICNELVMYCDSCKYRRDHSSSRRTSWSQPRTWVHFSFSQGPWPHPVWICAWCMLAPPPITADHTLDKKRGALSLPSRSTHSRISEWPLSWKRKKKRRERKGEEEQGRQRRR